MKVDKIIFAVDDNPEYQGFWEINSEICEKVLGITPILFRVTDHETDFMKSEFGYVKNVKSLNNVDTGFQAQIYRMYGTKYFPNEICMTSDIDMILFNKNYIESNLQNISDDDLVILNSDAYDENRSECYGIYSGPNRYPICYNVGKGNTFNNIIHTDVSFEDYCDRLLSLNLGWDTDEIYFGRCVNSQTKINVVKIKRGYSSNFYCPNRIEKTDFYKKGIFCLDLEENINLQSFIDCHCARPYEKHKKTIDNIKKILLGKTNEVYLIGCHIENETQEKYLRELIDTLELNNKDFVLTSHTPIPNDLIKKSVGYIYDSINPKYKTWELENYPLFNFETNSFIIQSPYISYGSSDYYHVGVIRLFINSLKFLKTTKYDIVHWIEYDCLPDFYQDSEANKLLNENDFIFYGVGQKFSFKLNKVNNSFLNMNNREILNELKNYDYLAEKLLKFKLINGDVKTFYLDETETNKWGRYSQNFTNTKINWSLFKLGNDIHLFIHNVDENPQSTTLEINNFSTTIDLPPHNWNLRNLIEYGKIKNLKVSNNNKILVDTDLSIVENYNNIIEKVKFINKE